MVDRYTSGAYAQDNPGWHAEDAAHKAAALVDLIRYAGLHPRTVADVGCGTGDVLRLIRDALADSLPDTVWEGWDVAPPAIRAARKREGQRLLYVCEDFLRSERHVDLLLCIDVVEHVPDDVAFVTALGQRADWLLFRIPLDLSALDVVRPARMLAARRSFGHRHLYTREVALQLMEEAGLRVECVRYDRVPPPLDTPRRRAADRLRRTLFAAWPRTTARILGGFSLLVLARPG